MKSPLPPPTRTHTLEVVEGGVLESGVLGGRAGAAHCGLKTLSDRHNITEY